MIELPDRATLALIIGSVGMVYSTIALLIVLLRHPRTPERPVEGMSGLNAALNRPGRDLPTAELPEPRLGAVYTSRHRRKGKGRWLANLGRTHARRNAAAQRHLP